MRLAICSLLISLAALPAAAAEPASKWPALKSLHGTLVINENEQRPLEFWAKGDNVRAEITDERGKIVNIQQGNQVYTFVEGAKTGDKKTVSPGLRASGLVPRIATIRAKARRGERELVEGRNYDKYTYTLDPPPKLSIVYLSVETGLPSLWISKDKVGPNDVVIIEEFRELEPNVEVPDERFTIPAGMSFTERPELELRERFRASEGP